MLDPFNEVDIVALYFTFILSISEKLDAWRHAWSKHLVRAIKTSPLRLWVAGQINCPLDEGKVGELMVKVARVVKLNWLLWSDFVNLAILIKLYKIRYLNLHKALLFPRKQAIFLKNSKL